MSSKKVVHKWREVDKRRGAQQTDVTLRQEGRYPFWPCATAGNKERKCGESCFVSDALAEGVRVCWTRMVKARPKEKMKLECSGQTDKLQMFPAPSFPPSSYPTHFRARSESKSGLIPFAHIQASRLQPLVQYVTQVARVIRREPSESWRNPLTNSMDRVVRIVSRLGPDRLSDAHFVRALRNRIGEYNKAQSCAWIFAR